LQFIIIFTPVRLPRIRPTLLLWSQRVHQSWALLLTLRSCVQLWPDLSWTTCHTGKRGKNQCYKQ